MKFVVVSKISRYPELRFQTQDLHLPFNPIFMLINRILL